MPVRPARRRVQGGRGISGRGTKQHLGSHLLGRLVLSWRISGNQVVSELEGCRLLKIFGDFFYRVLTSLGE